MIRGTLYGLPRVNLPLHYSPGVSPVWQQLLCAKSRTLKEKMGSSQAACAASQLCFAGLSGPITCSARGAPLGAVEEFLR